MKILLTLIFVFLNVSRVFPQSEFSIKVDEYNWSQIIQDYVNLEVKITVRNTGNEEDWCKQLQDLRLNCSKPYTYDDIELIEYSETFKAYMKPGESTTGYLIFKVPIQADELTLEITRDNSRNIVLLFTNTYLLNKLSRTYGGIEDDKVESIIATIGGDYVVAGHTSSFGAGILDFWIIKLDSKGNKIWDKTFGGSNNDMAESITATTDGGYIVAGWTGSFGAGILDFWVIKLDAEGNKIWDKTFGGSNLDYASSIITTSDGGYMIAGMTESYGSGKSDFWIIKLDAKGNKQWDKIYGGKDKDEATSIISTTDEGYIVAGTTKSYGAGGSDFWVIKLDSKGNKQWEKTYGGKADDNARTITTTIDGGYIVAGWTESYGAGKGDFWILKLDKDGNITEF